MKVLVTGGAGFIGSNLVKTLISDNRIEKVRVLDNLATGSWDNLSSVRDHSKLEIIEGDIRNYDTCISASSGLNAVLHQAALGSVPRSIKDPLLTNAVNISGTLNIFKAAVESNIERVIFAASSSTYGDSPAHPKMEKDIGMPLSPYAVTKYVNELYAHVFAKTYDLKFIGLRYFNVFGPHQDPNGPYAAVIPIFFEAAISGKKAIINGDGLTSRDFTYVDNAVQANIKALFTENEEALNQIYNVACAQETSLNQLWNEIRTISNSDIQVSYGPSRKGDVKKSLADISKARRLLAYEPKVLIKDGLLKTFDWYKIRWK